LKIKNKKIKKKKIYAWYKTMKSVDDSAKYNAHTVFSNYFLNNKTQSLVMFENENIKENKN